MSISCVCRSTLKALSRRDVLSSSLKALSRRDVLSQHLFTAEISSGSDFSFSDTEFIQIQSLLKRINGSCSKSFTPEEIVKIKNLLNVMSGPPCVCDICLRLFMRERKIKRVCDVLPLPHEFRFYSSEGLVAHILTQHTENLVRKGGKWCHCGNFLQPGVLCHVCLLKSIQFYNCFWKPSGLKCQQAGSINVGICSFIEKARVEKVKAETKQEKKWKFPEFSLKKMMSAATAIGSLWCKFKFKFPPSSPPPEDFY